jgi:hypothetical protein
MLAAAAAHQQLKARVLAQADQVGAARAALAAMELLELRI